MNHLLGLFSLKKKQKQKKKKNEICRMTVPWRLLVLMFRLHIVQPSMKSWSRSVAVDGNGQDASWEMCVWSFISLEALVFEKQS